jgi:hypothetical protein
MDQPTNLYFIYITTQGIYIFPGTSIPALPAAWWARLTKPSTKTGKEPIKSPGVSCSFSLLWSNLQKYAEGNLEIMRKTSFIFLYDMLAKCLHIFPIYLGVTSGSLGTGGGVLSNRSVHHLKIVWKFEPARHVITEDRYFMMFNFPYNLRTNSHGTLFLMFFRAMLAFRRVYLFSTAVFSIVADWSVGFVGYMILFSLLNTPCSNLQIYK